jgi:hypothetical protein
MMCSVWHVGRYYWRMRGVKAGCDRYHELRSMRLRQTQPNCPMALPLERVEQ